MALLHPADRFSTASSKSTAHNDGKMHPCVGLIAGFGFIFGVATVVHVVFNMVM